METTRAIFVSGNKEVRQYNVQIDWTQDFKENRNVVAKIAQKTIFNVPILEVSTQGWNILGVRLSARNLVMSGFIGKNPDKRKIEEVYQNSKKCINGRLNFIYNGVAYPLEPKSIFYDWLYCIALGNNMLCKQRAYINKEQFLRYRMFTDIWFNPTRKVACQARSCALFSVLLRTNRVKEAMSSFENFMKIHKEIVSYETYTK